MEDYIFLIIAVVISIFAAINKSQKAKMADQPLAEKESKLRNFFMDQLLGEDFLQEPVVVKPKAIRVQPAPEKVVFTSSRETQRGLKFQLPRFKSTLPDRPKHQSIAPRQRIIEEVESNVETEETISYLEDFSFRKAVVYSQIMERKY